MDINEGRITPEVAGSYYSLYHHHLEPASDLMGISLQELSAAKTQFLSAIGDTF